jgi:hypothetical protein
MFRTQKKFKHGRKFQPLSVDPYTGEFEPDGEDAGKLLRVRPPGEERRHGRHYPPEEESILEIPAADEGAEQVSPYASAFDEDEQIEEGLTEVERLGAPDRQHVVARLDAHSSKSPGLTGDDLEPDWLAEELAAIRVKAKNKKQRA